MPGKVYELVALLNVLSLVDAEPPDMQDPCLGLRTVPQGLPKNWVRTLLSGIVDLGSIGTVRFSVTRQGHGNIQESAPSK